LAINLVVFKKSPLQKGSLDNGKVPSKKNKLDVNLSLFSIATLPQKGILHVSRSQIEAKARSIVETFIVENTCELPPLLLEVKITRLYVLLSDTYIVMDRKLLEKPKDIMLLLMKLETYGTLGNMIISTFG
jgi:predicted house-cleaning NTP pyrophosphatase (Maf/HAM1 superfamily)